MITKVSELLKGFIDEERKKLDEYNLTHGPTIGKMYEGLTSDVLEKTIPPSLNLRIVSGFIVNDQQVQTGQIDCMLVKGEGIQIPYTNDYKWHIRDVIAVFEVKKTLYAKDLEDSYIHLREVYKSYWDYTQSEEFSEKIDISSARKVFSQMTGVVAPPFDRVTDLSLNLQMIYHSLVMEQLCPIRIIIGYHGFKSEFALREKLTSFIEDNLLSKGFGIVSFPQLIVSGDYSLIKVNGQPYLTRLRNESWDFYVSSSDNPVLFILELIWTKIEREYPIGGFWGDDLEVDTFNPLLSATAVEQDNQTGWAFTAITLTNKELQERSGRVAWEPIYLNITQFVVISRLCNGDKVAVSDTEFIEWLRDEKYDLNIFITELIETGLVGLEGDIIKLVSEQCVCGVLPTGDFVAAENNSGRFTRWLTKKMASRNDTNPI